MSELVLALYRNSLTHQNIPTDATGIFNFDLSTVNSHDYALLPRHIADLKDKQTKKMPEHILALGKTFPQILGYFQIVDEQGRYLAYQRKGKEKGLFGQWSIGVGGHVDLQDINQVIAHTGEDYPSVSQVIYAGADREITEELNIDSYLFEELSNHSYFEEAVTKIIQSYNAETSAVHLGLPMELQLSDAMKEMLNLNPDEFNNVRWMSKAELKDEAESFEDWSQMLIQEM